MCEFLEHNPSWYRIAGIFLTISSDHVDGYKLKELVG